MMRKLDSTYRMCIDYRKLNEIAKKDVYPLPKMDFILEKLRTAKYITPLDLRLEYHQIPIDEESREYTAFTVLGMGLFEFTRMLFGLSGATATFQRLIESLISPEIEPYVYAYLDDIEK